MSVIFFVLTQSKTKKKLQLVYKKSTTQTIIQIIQKMKSNRLQPNFFEVTTKKSVHKCFIKLIKNNCFCYYKNILKIQIINKIFFF